MRWRFAAAGFAAYIAALVATAPAGLLDVGLEGASGGRLRLTGAQGRLWSGTGRMEMRAQDGRALAAQDLRWRLLPDRLIQARLAFEFESDRGPSFVLAVGPGRVEITGVAIALPAAALTSLQPKLAPLQLSGDLDLRIGQLVIAAEGWSGGGTVQWHRAGSALTKVFPLGEYELQWLGEGATARISLATLGGPLQLEGKGSLARGGRLAFTVLARIDAEFRPMLDPLLRLIAVDRGDGSFELQLG